MLYFSLDTAEKSLSETLPHVVTKLVEGRGKRLEALENMAMERRKDIEHRSAETCATSSSHLEAFQAKAERKLKEAEAESQQALAELRELIASMNSGDV